MPTYIKHVPGQAPLNHTHAFESLSHAYNVINHMGEAGGKGNPSPSALNYWAPLSRSFDANDPEQVHAAEVELLRRLRIFLGEDGSGDVASWTGDDRIFWARRLFRELSAEHKVKVSK